MDSLGKCGRCPAVGCNRVIRVTCWLFLVSALSLSGCLGLRNKDAPVQEAASQTGWRVIQQVRFQRSVQSSGPFATAWQLCSHSDFCAKGAPASETVFWYDISGAPSDAWWELVGALYYWRLRKINPVVLRAVPVHHQRAVCVYGGPVLAGHARGSTYSPQLGGDGGVCRAGWQCVFELTC